MSYLYNEISIKNQRFTNMDAVFIKKRSIQGCDVLLSVVCDGVGSLHQGGYASNKSVEMLSEWFENLINIDRIGINMRDTVLSINTSIIKDSNEENLVTATTLSALILINNFYYIVHVGDSRIYSFDGFQFKSMTNDDISDKGKLTQWIGKKDDLFLQYYEGEISEPLYLVCSDGLHKRMDNSFFANNIKFKNSKQLLATLNAFKNYVIDRGESDNISAVLIKIES